MEARRLLASDWQNPLTPSDVDQSGVTSPIDALLVINEIHARDYSDPQTWVLPPSRVVPSMAYLDVDGDGRITQSDAQAVLDAIDGRDVVSGAVATVTNGDGYFQSVPLSFEPLAPRSDGSVDFVSRGFGYQFGFSSQHVAMSFTTASGSDRSEIGTIGANDAASDSSVVMMRWVGGSAGAAGVDLASHVSNYLVGDDSTSWRTNVPNYRGLYYDDVYEGIDLAFYGNAGELEYDWIVEAGVEPGQIVMAFNGANDIRVNDQGQLVLATDGGDLVQRAPELYQMIDGHRIGVEGVFRINDDQTVGFTIGTYDSNQALIIDPRFVYSTTLGGDSFDGANAVVVDDDGNAYVTGRTDSQVFITTDGAFQSTRGDTNSSDVWVAKFDPDGHLVWSTLIGGSGYDEARGIGLSDADEIWIAGGTDSNNFPTLDGLYGTLDGTELDAFVARLSADGTQLLYGTYFGGLGLDFANDLTTGSDGSVYVTGSTQSAFLPRVNHIIRDFAGGDDAFVAKLSADGLDVLFSTYFGGGGQDSGESIAVDHEGNMYVVGWTSGLIPYVNGLQTATASQDGTDAFLVKIAGDYSDLVYSTALHGSGGLIGQLDSEYAYGVDVYGDGIAAVVGQTSSGNWLTTSNAVVPSSPTVGNPDLINITDGFLTVIDTTKFQSESLVYGTYFGSEQYSDQVNAVTFDQFGNVLLVGQTRSEIGFPLTPDALEPDYGGPSGASLAVGDSFIAKINPFAEDSLIYSSYYGDIAHDDLNDIAINDSGDVTVVGEFGAAFTPFWTAIVAQYDFDLRQSSSITQGRQAPAFEKNAGQVGTFQTTREGAMAGDFDVSVFWGDGLSSAATAIQETIPGTFAVFAEHTYTSPGAYPITMSVGDNVDADLRPAAQINVSQESGDQFAPVITDNPAGLATFMIADAGPGVAEGLMTAVSYDDGLTWERGTFGGVGSELGIPGSQFDAVFDDFGHLWVAYSNGGRLAIARSVDDGTTFEIVPVLDVSQIGPTDRIAIAAGPLNDGALTSIRTIWVTFQNIVGEIYVTNAVVTESTLPVIGVPELVAEFEPLVSVQSPDIAVGPDGKAIVVWQHNEDVGPPRLHARMAESVTDEFGEIFIVESGYPFSFDPNVELLRSEGMRPSIVFDRSGGEYDGRAYVAYQRSGFDPTTSGVPMPFEYVFGLDTYITYSDDGESWRLPNRVNRDIGLSRQISPSIAIDQYTGNVAVGWYDARNDPDDVKLDFFVAASNDGGRHFESEVALTSAGIDAPQSLLRQTALTYRNDDLLGSRLIAAWADNASNLGIVNDSALDISVSVVGVMDVPEAPIALIPIGFDAIENTTAGGLIATFTTRDPSRDENDFRATVNWGDGTAPHSVEVTQPNGPGTPFHITGSHEYVDEGVYPIGVEVREPGSIETSSSFANTTRMGGSQSNGTIAVDPTNANRVFVAAENPSDPGRIVVSVSDDGGATWESRKLGDSLQDLPLLSRHPRAAFDEFGNLFLVVSSDPTDETGATGPQQTVLLTSTDGGRTFVVFEVFPSPQASHPAVAVGPNTGGIGQAVWVTQTISLEDGAGATDYFLEARAFSVTGLGQFGEAISTIYAPFIPDPLPRGRSDITIGPNGHVLTAWVDMATAFNASILTAVDPDGLGPVPFELPVHVDTTFPGGLPGLIYTVPDQPSRGISPAPRLAWDHSDSLYRGRAYVVYTVSDNPGIPNDLETRIVLRYSEDNGESWSEPAELYNSEGSNFHPAIEVDPSTGVVAVSYFASSPQGDGVVRVLLLSGDGGQTFSILNLALSVPYLESTDTNNPQTDYQSLPPMERIELGDYGEMAFIDGVAHIAWPTNSLSLPQNPRPADLEIAEWQVGVANVYGAELNFTFAEDFTAVEGEHFDGVIAFFEDLDPDPVPQHLGDYEAIIDWGDGLHDTGVVFLGPNGTYGIEVEHTYADPGSYPVNIFVQGQRTDVITTVTATVEEAPLLAFHKVVRVVEDVEFSEAVAQFSDENNFAVASDYTATIDWGDGSSSPGVIEFSGMPGPPLLFNVIGTHTYSEEQSHTVTVTIEEHGAQPANSDSDLAVAADDDTEPTVQSVVANSTVFAGDPVISIGTLAEIGALEDVSTGIVTLARFELGPGPIDTHPGAYTAEIDWDDSTITAGQVSIVGNEVLVRGEHTYVNGGTFFPTVSLVDDSGGSAFTAVTAVIATNVTNAVNVNSSGLAFNPSTQTFVGNVQIFNSSGVNLTGDFRIAFDDLTPDATLLTATDTTLNGEPYVKVDYGMLFSGGVLPNAPLEFSVPDPLNASINYTPRVYAGAQFLGSSLDPTQQSAAYQEFGTPFEQNIGQVDDAAQFVSRGVGYVIYLTDKGAIVRLDSEVDATALSMRWVGASESLDAIGIHQRQGVSHYLIGDDESQWVTDVPTFDRVRYEDIYDGIDIELHSGSGALQYDWYVAAGADPTDIVMAFDGADELTIDGDGNLNIDVDGETIVHRAPTLYQHVDGDVIAVDGSFVLLGDDQVTYAIGDYDVTHGLVIDPVLEYTSYLGGDFIDQGVEVLVDANGNTIVVGNARSADFPVVNALDDSHQAQLDLGHSFDDAFITKIDPTGNILFSTFFGASGGPDTATGAVLDQDGNIVFVGSTDSSAFPTTGDAFQPIFGGATRFFSGDGFVTKLDPTGSSVVYSSFLGGVSSDVITDVAIDDNGALHLVGATESLEFPSTPGVLQTDHADPADPFSGGAAADFDGFLAKVAADGSLAYATLLGGVGNDVLTGVSTDATGFAHVVGYTEADGLPTPGGVNPMRGGMEDAYVAIINADASAVTYGTYLGGTQNDQALDVLADNSGSTRIVGWTESDDFDTLNALQGYGGERDGFITTIATAGALVQSSYIGTEADDEAVGVGVDANGNVFVVGEVGSSSFATVDAVQPFYGGGDSDAFVTQFDSTIAHVIYATFLGGNGVDRLNGIFVEPDGTASVVGMTLSTDLRTVAATQPQIGLAPAFVRDDAMMARIAPTDSGVISVATQSFAAIEGRAFDGLVGTFISTSSDAADAYTATIDWGDGTVGAGVITQAGNGQFDVAGNHLYETFGSYAVMLTVEHVDGTIANVMSTTAAVAASQGFVDYHVSIDTSSLAGTDGVVSYQFNPALIGGSAPGLVTLRDFSLDGGSLNGDPTIEGGAAGSMVDHIVVNNSVQLNRLSQQLTFGDVMGFHLRLSGEMLTDTTAGLFASTFVVQLLGDSGVTPLMTDNPTGAVLAVDVLSDRRTQAYAYADALGNRAAVAATGKFATVIDAPIAGTALPINALEGALFDGVVATFTDDNPFGRADEFTATIDWGDGRATTQGIITQTGGSAFNISGTHVYAEIGQYTVDVTIDSIGGFTTKTEALTGGIPGLQAAHTFLIGGDPFFLSSGDFDNDGNLDIVIPAVRTGSTRLNHAILLFGRGDGTFEDALEVPAGAGPLHLTLGDFNNDGNLDFVTTSVNNYNVILGNGDRTFQAPITNVLQGASRLSSADLNHDGNLDMIMSTFILFVGAGVELLLGNGDGTFRTDAAFTANPAESLIDINDDGDLDKVLFMSDSPNQTLAIQYNNGDWTFAAPFEVTVPVTGVTAFAHMNSDGFLDMVVNAPSMTHVLLGDSSGGYGAPMNVTSNASLSAIKIVDFDGDGDLDVIAPRPGNSSEFLGGVDVMLNLGNGTLTDAIEYSAPARPRDSTIGDFNNDGVMDVAAITIPSGTQHALLTLALGNMDGSIVAPLRYDLNRAGIQGFAIDWAIDDLNQDGHFDIVLQPSDDGMSAILNMGDGTFGNPTEEISLLQDTLTLGDVNEDGLPDLIYTTASLVTPMFEGVHVRLGNGDGTFGADTFYFVERNPSSAAGHNFTDVGVGDLDGDGHVDLLVADAAHSKILRGNGDGTFQAPEQLIVGSQTTFGPTKVILEDFNNDGKLDLATAGIFVALGNGDGTFQRAILYLTDGGGFESEVADVNLDGKMDIVTVTRASQAGDGAIHVLLGDGAGRFAPAARFAESDVGYRSLTLGDFNNDGSLDVAALGGVAKPNLGPVVGLTVVFNNGDGTFGEPSFYEPGEFDSTLIATGLFDKDLIPDIIVAPSHTLAVITSKIGASGASVGNAPLTVMAHDMNPVIGVAFTAAVARFDDDNTLAALGDHSAEIQWGDGTTSDGTIAADPRGGFLVTGSHVYQQVGSFDVTVTVNDDSGGSAQDAAMANVTGANGAITASPLVFDAEAGGSFITSVATFTDSDPNGAVGDFTATIQWGDGNSSVGGIVEDNGGFAVIGHYQYAVGGEFDVQVDITDIGGGDDSVVSTGNVAANNAPVATGDAYGVNEDAMLSVQATLGVLSNDNDADGDILSAVLGADVAHGVLALSSDGSFTYEPNANFNGIDSFTYAVHDGRGGIHDGTVTLTVAPVNDTPKVADDSAQTDEDVPVVIDVLLNDDDVDGDALIALRTTDAAHGTVVVNLDQMITYTPNANFNGVDEFRYTAYDNAGGFAVATVLLTVHPVNDEPTANADNATTSEDIAVIIDVLGDDSDVEGDTLVIIDISQPANGAVVVNADQTITYTPNADFNGDDQFTYTISDGTEGVAASAAVAVKVLPANDPPVAAIDGHQTPEDTPLVVDAITGVLRNDDDIDGDPLSALLVRDVQHGVLQLQLNGSFVYTPDLDYNGSDTFQYRTVDTAGGRSGAVTVSIEVTPVNDVPVAREDTAETSEDKASVIAVLANDFDVDGDALSIIGATDPPNGDVAINGDGTITYTPDSDFNGMDSFTYTVSDGNGGSDTAVVHTTVNPAVCDSEGVGSDIIVTPTTGLTTSEVGATDQFTIELTVCPIADVTVELYSSNTSEGVLSPPMVVFTPEDWDSPRIVTVTGVDDPLADGDTAYFVITAWATSLDRRYHGINPDDVSLVNVDDDSTVMPGDLNHDLNIDDSDIDELHAALRERMHDVQYDLDGSGTVDVDDVQFLVSTIIGTQKGDANLDHKVDGIDFGIWRQFRFSENASWSTADFNGDGITDESDFIIWSAYRFQQSDPALDVVLSSNEAGPPRAALPATATWPSLADETTLRHIWKTHDTKESLSEVKRPPINSKSEVDEFYGHGRALVEFAMRSRYDTRALASLSQDRFARSRLGNDDARKESKIVATVDELFADFGDS